jgi:glycosyltransferase involved in cell wall biosynthesis
MKKIAIILPCYNESILIGKFNDSMVHVLKQIPCLFDLIYVNDGSVDNTSQIILDLKCDVSNINIQLLNLQYNVGHQFAIFQGLLYTRGYQYDNVLIMDSDGEDDPLAIGTILNHAENDIVQVSRGKRSESFMFKLLYNLYKIIFLFLIGKKIDYGNFSLIKPRIVAAAIDNSFSHLGAFLDNQKATKYKVQWNRRKRLDGVSKMSFRNLFYHGIRALTENAESLLFFFIRILIFIAFLIFILTGLILYNKFIVHEAVLGWSSTLLTNLLNSLLLCSGFFVIGSLQLNILSKQGKKGINGIFHSIMVIENWKKIK